MHLVVEKQPYYEISLLITSSRTCLVEPFYFDVPARVCTRIGATIQLYHVASRDVSTLEKNGKSTKKTNNKNDLTT